MMFGFGDKKKAEQHRLEEQKRLEGIVDAHLDIALRKASEELKEEMKCEIIQRFEYARQDLRIMIQQGGEEYHHRLQTKLSDLEKEGSTLLASFHEKVDSSTAQLSSDRERLASAQRDTQVAVEEISRRVSENAARMEEIRREAEVELQRFKEGLASKERVWMESVERILHSIAQRTQQPVEEKKEKEVEGQERVVLNVGGTRFETLRTSLVTYPETLLGAMFSDRNSELLHQAKEFFFDRDPHFLPFILHFYRTGDLIKPPDIPKKLWHQELDYWNLPRGQSTEQEKEKKDTLGSILALAYKAKEDASISDPSSSVESCYEWLKDELSERIAVLTDNRVIYSKTKWEVIRLWAARESMDSAAQLLETQYQRDIIDLSMHQTLASQDSGLEAILVRKFKEEEKLTISFSHLFSVSKRVPGSISNCVVKSGPLILISVHRPGSNEEPEEEDSAPACVIS